MLFVSRGTSDVWMNRDMGLCLLQVLIEQRCFIHIVFKDVLYMLVRRSLSLQCSFTGIVEPLRTIGLVKLDDTHSPFITYFRIIMGGQDFLYAAQYICSMKGCFPFKEFRVPVGIKFMSAAEMFCIGDILPLAPLRWCSAILSC